MGTRRVDSNVANLPGLPCLSLPHVLHSLSLTLACTPIARDPKHNIPIPDRPSCPSHPLARVLPVPGWITEALPLVPPRGWEIRTAMRLMLRNWKLARDWPRDAGWRVSACRPSGPDHWLPPSQHEKEDSPESALLFC